MVEVSFPLSAAAGAGVILAAIVSTGTGIHSGDQNEIGWEFNGLSGAGDTNAMFFYGFSKQFQGMPIKFRQFI